MAAEIEVKEILVDLRKKACEIPLNGEGVRIYFVEDGRVGEMELPQYGELLFRIHQGKISHIERTSAKKGIWK